MRTFAARRDFTQITQANQQTNERTNQLAYQQTAQSAL